MSSIAHGHPIPRRRDADRVRPRLVAWYARVRVPRADRRRTVHGHPRQQEAYLALQALRP